MSKTKLVVVLSLGWLATLALGIIIGAMAMYKNCIFRDIQADQHYIRTEIEKIKKEQEWVDFVSKSLESLIETMETGDTNLETIKRWNRRMVEIDKKLETGNEKSIPKKESPEFKGSGEYKDN